MTTLEKLSMLFGKFPGIGPRQARRFVYHLLSQDPAYIRELSEFIATIQDNIIECAECFRFFAKNGGGKTCDICSNSGRDHEYLMIVEQDADIAPIERSGSYKGYYFVLGGTVPLLESEDMKKIRGGALKKIVEKRLKDGLKEVILAFSVNPDGENTARYVESLLSGMRGKKKLKTSTLGRGLSTGSELEYVDDETIKNALENRS